MVEFCLHLLIDQQTIEKYYNSPYINLTISENNEIKIVRIDPINMN